MAAKKKTNHEIEALPSISTVVGKELEIGESLFIAGRVHSKREVTGRGGDQLQFKGEFGLKIGENKFSSSKAYLPYKIADTLEAALNSRKDKEPVEFAVRLFKVESDKSTRGFVWDHEVIKMPEIAPTNVFKLLE